MPPHQPVPITATSVWRILYSRAQYLYGQIKPTSHHRKPFDGVEYRIVRSISGDIPLARQAIDRLVHQVKILEMSVWRWLASRRLAPRGGKIRGTSPLSSAHQERKAALAGSGSAHLFEDYVCGDVEQARLVEVLHAWKQELPSWYLYYPSRRHMSAAVRVFLEYIRRQNSKAASRLGASRDAVLSD